MPAKAGLAPAADHGPFTGFANMLDKEYGAWWRTRRALIHLVLWLVVVNGFLFMIGLDEAGEGSPFALLDDLIEIFFRVGGLFTAIGIVVTTQSTVLDERRSGTAEWVLSKPVTRHAFMMSKLVMNGLSFIGLAALVPAVAFFSQTLLHTYLQPDLWPFLTGMILYVQQLLFYLTLTLALGTFLNSRGAVSGAAIGLIFAGLIVPNFLPESLAFGPWGLTGLGYAAAMEQALPEWAWQAILTTTLWIALFVLVGLWRFEHEEF